MVPLLFDQTGSKIASVSISVITYLGGHCNYSRVKFMHVQLIYVSCMISNDRLHRND